MHKSLQKSTHNIFKKKHCVNFQITFTVTHIKSCNTVTGNSLGKLKVIFKQHSFQHHYQYEILHRSVIFFIKKRRLYGDIEIFVEDKFNQSCMGHATV